MRSPARIPLSQLCRPVFDQLQTVFTGEFDKVIVQANGVSDFIHLEKEVLTTVKIPPRGITELDRLSHVVHQIDFDCQIVPIRAADGRPIPYDLTARVVQVLITAGYEKVELQSKEGGP